MLSNEGERVEVMVPLTEAVTDHFCLARDIRFGVDE